MTKTAKRQLGDIGEGVACKYLEKRGYKIIERNYLKPWGEIDIIAERAGLVSFVEVKSVSREPREKDGSREKWWKIGYRPEENVHPVKLKRLHRAIQTYLLERRVPEDKLWQIDVACVYLDFEQHRAHVEMLENVIL